MAGYTAYYGNSLKKLSALYSGTIFKVKLFDNNSIVIVQNRNMEEWLKFGIASDRGLCNGISFMFQEQAVRYVLSFFPDLTVELEKKSIVYLDDLKIIIYRKLESILSSIEKYPDFIGLKKYIDDSAVSSDSDNGKEDVSDDPAFIRGERLFFLSDSIAGLFYHYGLNCAEMTASWGKGKSFLDNSEYSYLLGHEKWQMVLWNMIFSEGSRYIHPGQIITGILENKYAVPEINMNIAIFGSSFLSEQSVSFFQYLSSVCNVTVDHFILSPSPSFSTNGKPADADDSPASQRWSSLVTGLSRLLSDKKITVKEYFDCPSSSTLLGSLKTMIFNNKIHPVPEFTAADNSLQIISAPGKKREIEILKNSILGLVSSEKIKFHEIGVAAPDINAYLPYIESIFPSSDDLLDVPYNIMDISFAMQSQYVKGFLSLTELCGARFTRKELFTLFSNPCFMEKFELDEKDIAKWLDICGELSIKWGLDSGHRRDALSYIDKSGTWTAGFERVASGLVFDESEGEVVFSDKGAVLPYSLTDSNEEKKISLMFAVSESLYRDLYHIKKKEMELTGWTSFFETIMDRYLEPVPGFQHEKDKSFLKNIFRQINNLAGGREKEETENLFPFPVFKALLDGYSDAGGYYKGQYLSSGVCFSSIKPLRAIPFRAIFLIGMDINTFPGKDNPPGYDLRNLTEKSIDLTKQNTDSFAFLETIISAEEKLVISYNGTDPVTGTSEDPSVLVTEIEDMTGKYAAEQITSVHPLKSYDPACFDGSNGKILSYDSRNYLPALCVSSVTSGGKRNNVFYPVFVKKQMEGAVPDCSPVKAGTDIFSLLQFLKTPLSHYSRTIMGLSSNPLSLPENDITETIGIPWHEQFNITDEISKISKQQSFDDFIESALKARILDSRAGNIPATRVEYDLLKKDTLNFYKNLEKSGYFSLGKVKVTIGRGSYVEKNDEIVSLSFPAVVFEGEKGVLEISGNLPELRCSGSDYFSVVNGKFKLKNIAGHLLNYLLLSKINGKNSAVTYSVFDLNGNRKGVFSSGNVAAGIAESAVADAFISASVNPWVVDPDCIENGIKCYKNGGNTDDVIISMKQYYENNSFSDMKYLKGFDNVSPWFDDVYFRKLLENFYSHLVF